MIFIESLKDEDAHHLFKFESENKQYFETMVPNRPDGYYQFDYFRIILNELLAEQLSHKSYFFLIKDEDGTILGRINLVDIENQTGHLGYRIGEKYIGKGIATEALKQLLNVVKSLQVERICAKTMNNNKGSQLVMERNDFKKVENEEKPVSFKGEDVYFVKYVWDNL